MRLAGVSPNSKCLVISSEKMIVFWVGLKARARPAQQQAPHYFIKKKQSLSCSEGIMSSSGVPPMSERLSISVEKILIFF
jgi:hypothetical protein